MLGDTLPSDTMLDTPRHVRGAKNGVKTLRCRSTAVQSILPIGTWRRESTGGRDALFFFFFFRVERTLFGANTRSRNYLPHMSWPEVQDLPARTDVVIIALGALEQHGPQLPAGTDYLSAGERAKLIAQKTEVLVAPILLPGLSPYRMEFPGTISLSHETLQASLFRGRTESRSARIPAHSLPE